MFMATNMGNGDLMVISTEPDDCRNMVYFQLNLRCRPIIIEVNVRKKANFGFIVIMCLALSFRIRFKRVRVGNHHAIGQKMAMPVQYRTLHDIEIYRQYQYKQQLRILSDKFHFLFTELQK